MIFSLEYTILNQKRHWIYFFLGLLGLSLIILEINIYRLTLVNPLWLILIIFLVGVISYKLDIDQYARTYNVDYIKFFCFGQNVVSFGFIICSIFMILNYYGSSDLTKAVSTEIISVSDMPGPRGNRQERKPLIRVKINKFEKELVFKHSDMDKLKYVDYVKLVVSEGFFGLKVIKDQELVMH